MEKKKLILPLAGLALAVSGATGVVAVAHADSSSTTDTTTSTTHPKMTPPVATGTVTAVSGDTITLSDKRDSTTYTVDASNATITKFSKPTSQGEKPTSTTISVSDIAVGDTLSVEGTKNGTDVTATSITDGMAFGFGGGRMGGAGNGGMGMGVFGTVSAVNGSTLTVTGKDGKSYTVDASSATASKMESISVSDIQVGDSVGVQGSVSGTTVTAKSVMDGVMMPGKQGS